jgi:DUF1680 family protein
VNTLQPLPVGALTIEAGFWAEFQELNRAAIIPHGLAWVHRTGWVGNFEAAAAGQPFQHVGAEFADSEVYKLLEAIAWELDRRPDAALASRFDALVDTVAAAQEPDGYLHTGFGRPGQPGRYTDLEWGHELYCFGHLLQAAAAAVRAGRGGRLRTMAERLVEHIDAEFGPTGREAVCGHPEIELGLTELFQATGDRRLLTLAAGFVERRGRGTLASIEYGRGYFQDETPVRESDTLHGHAVRALYLASGAVDVACATGDTELLDAVVKQWDHAVACRTYLTGGMGSRHQDESFGDDFELPPDRAYAETCAAIGSVMLSWRLLLATGEPRFAELIERTLFNNVISSPRADGRAFFYVNTLHQRTPGTIPDEFTPTNRAESGLRAPWFDVSCCPPNLARTLAHLGHYFASVSDTALHLHQLGSFRIQTPLDGHAIDVRLESGFPHEGNVTMTLLAPLPARTFLRLRIPAWARGVATASSTGPGVDIVGDEVVVSGPRPSGQTVTVTFPLEVRVVRPPAHIDAIRGQVAFERGPFVLATEDVDLPHGVTVNDIAIQPESRESVAHHLRVRAVRIGGQATSSWPYVVQSEPGPPLDLEPPQPAEDLVAVYRPYYQWGNRGPTTMRVWTPEWITEQTVDEGEA